MSMLSRLLALMLAMFIAAPASAMFFSIEEAEDYQWLEATGDITPDSAELFTALVNSGQFVRILVISSEGGSLWGGVRLGRAIRAAGFETYIAPGTSCTSSCFFAFIGGVSRTVDDGARLGVHQFYGLREGEEAGLAQATAQTITGELLAYVDDMGVSTRALERALRTPADSMYVFSRRELADWRIEHAVPEMAVSCPFPDEHETADAFGFYPECP